MHCCKKLAVSDKVQQMCQTYSTNDRYLWVKEIEIQGHVARKTTATNGGNVGMMETGVCAHSGVVLSRHAPTLRRENRDVRISQKLSRPKKREKRKDRCQNSVSVARAERADSSRIFLSFLHCRDFNEKPITRLSWSSLFASASHIPVYFNWVHRDPISFVLLLLFPFCSGLVRKTRSYSLTCLPANFLHHCIGTS